MALLLGPVRPLHHNHRTAEMQLVVLKLERRKQAMTKQLDVL
jgi:hypothetical protein